jgi:diaminopimelate epimerase
VGTTVAFLKGHGTENDFLVVPDPQAALDLTPALVAAACDRRAGVGADGVLRVVRTESAPEVADQAGEAEWFMDYRNADGSVAEMCGNGVRVFARYLLDAGLVDEAPLAVATRGGLRRVRFEDTGDVTVDMGPAVLPAQLAAVRVSVGERTWAATGVLLPNPHAVAYVRDLAEVGILDRPPRVEPAAAYPDGVNVELVAERGPAHVALRVHERGVGETRSCGTGACAVAVVARRRAGLGVGDDRDRAWTVDVPGGRLTVTERADAAVELTGPAVLVAAGELRQGWVEAHRGR